MTPQVGVDDPMRERILRATFVVLSRHGHGKFNLSDVAAQAGISRPTLYKSFASKDELLAASSEFEMHLLREGLGQAVSGLAGPRRVEALLQFFADYYRTHQMRGLIEIEPGLVLAQMGAALPTLVELIAPVLDGEVSDPESVATTLVRLTVCHYLVPGFDNDHLLDQLRAATDR